MFSPFSRLLRAQRTGPDKVVVDKTDPNKGKTGLNVTMAVFFDGTGNNRNNVAQRLIAEHNAQHPNDKVNEDEGVRWSGSYNTHGLDKHGKPVDNSYASGYSNVSTLEKLNMQRDLAQRDISLYVEGIGTENDQGDSTIPGSGLGVGATGIKKRVIAGIGRLGGSLAKIVRQVEDSYIKQITIDVFGFSRGSAAARHFVSLMHDKNPLATRLGTPQAQIIIKFVGVFDTVSSRGWSLLIGNDVASLGLALGSVPKRIVHLTASNEYRQNFSLTDIGSSVRAGNGYELALPGVHSDIGGSYAQQEAERRQLIPQEVPRLQTQGWYKEEQVHHIPHEVQDPDTGERAGVYYTVVGLRPVVQAGYQLIPLHVMADAARQVGAMQLESLRRGGPFGKYVLAAGHPLLPLQAMILGEVAKHSYAGRHMLFFPGDPRPTFPDGPAPQFTQLRLPPEQIATIRNTYLHRSASTGFQGLNDKRTGMGENRLNRMPHRTIFAG